MKQILSVPWSALADRTSLKWRTYPPDVLPLWVAEMDVHVAPAVQEAVAAALRTGDTGYPAGTPYAEALADFAAKRWQWRFETNLTAIVPDVMLGAVELIKLVTRPGGAVIVNPPVYRPFYQFIAGVDRVALDAPLGPEHRIDLDALERAFTVATAQGAPAAYLLCNPHNPTGTAHTRDELTAVADLADRHGVCVIADEIHAPLVHPGSTHTPFLSVTDRGFSLMSASKAWNLAGLKAALAVSGPDSAALLATMPEEVSHGPSHIGVLAHCAALTAGVDWLDQLLVELDEQRHRLAELLQRELPTVGYRVPEATYLAWLDCRGLGLGDDPAQAFLERGRVAVSSGPTFGAGGDGHVRLNFATSPEMLEEAVLRMAGAVGGLSSLR